MGSKQVDDDMHYRMCKKIAQLTKVIYSLNLQNEDNDTRVSDIRQRHEAEMRKLCESADKRIEEVKEAFQKAEQGRLSAVETAQKQYKDGLESAKMEYMRKVSEMAEDLKASKVRFEIAIKDVVEACKADAEKAIADGCRTKDEETANLVREYNDRYKTMLAEQMNARDELEKEVNGLRAKLEGTEKTYTQELKKLEAKRMDSELKATAELARWREACEKAEMQVRKLQEECNTLRGRVDEGVNSLGHCREAEVKLRESVAALERQLSDSQKQCETLNDVLRDKTQELAKKESIVINLENQRNLLETQNGELALKNTNFESQVTALEKRLRDVSAQLSEIEKLKQDEANKRDQSESQLQEMCAALQRHIEELESRHAEKLDEIRARHVQNIAEFQSSAAKAAEEARNEFLRDTEKMAKDHRDERDSILRDHEKEIAQLKRDQEREINNLRDNLSNVSRAEAEMQELEKTLRGRIASLENELEVAWKRLQETDRCLKDVSEKREEETYRYANRLEELEADAGRRIEVMREECDGRISALHAQLSEVQRQAESRLLDVVREWEKKLEEASTANNRGLVTELEVCRTANAQVLTLFGTLHGEQLHHFLQRAMMCLDHIAGHCSSMFKSFEEHVGQCKSEKEASQRALRESTDKIREREADIRRLKEQLEGVRGDANKRRSVLLEEIQVHKDLIAKLTKEKDELHASDKRLSDELQQFRREFDASQREVLAGQKRIQDLEDAVSMLKENLKTTGEEADKRLQDSLKAATDSYEQRLRSELENLRAASAKERDNLQRRADEALSALRQKYNNGQEQLRDAMLRIDALTNDVARCSEELALERRQSSEAQTRFNESLKQREQNHTKEIRQLQEKSECLLNDLGVKHKMFVDDLLQQQQQERCEQNRRISELQRAFEDLRHRYEYRESREEDVEMINRLMKEAKKKDHDLKKALEDMKMYKLELVNRENNYNKVFGRCPVVAPREAASKFQLR